MVDKKIEEKRKQEFDINQEAQMFPQAQYIVRRKRELENDKIRREQELERDEKIQKQHNFTKQISWVTLIIAILTFIVGIIGLFTK